jgi:hypothetical protein
MNPEKINSCILKEDENLKDIILSESNNKYDILEKPYYFD